MSNIDLVLTRGTDPELTGVRVFGNGEWRDPKTKKKTQSECNNTNADRRNQLAVDDVVVATFAFVAISAMCGCHMWRLRHGAMQTV